MVVGVGGVVAGPRMIEAVCPLLQKSTKEKINSIN
jgi:hypothetical protein